MASIRMAQKIQESCLSHLNAPESTLAICRKPLQKCRASFLYLFLNVIETKKNTHLGISKYYPAWL
jgi:hypothetical protein